MNIGKITSNIIFFMGRKSGFWISVFGYRAIVGSPVVLLVAMNELLSSIT